MDPSKPSQETLQKAFDQVNGGRGIYLTIGLNGLGEVVYAQRWIEEAGANTDAIRCNNKAITGTFTAWERLPSGEFKPLGVNETSQTKQDISLQESVDFLQGSGMTVLVIDEDTDFSKLPTLSELGLIDKPKRTPMGPHCDGCPHQDKAKAKVGEKACHAEEFLEGDTSEGHLEAFCKARLQLHEAQAKLQEAEKDLESAIDSKAEYLYCVRHDC